MWEDKVVRQGCHQLKTTLGDRRRRGMSHSHTILMTVWTVWGTGSLEFIVLPPECTALQRKRKVVAGLPLIIRVPATCFFSVKDACGLWMCACVCVCMLSPSCWRGFSLQLLAWWWQRSIAPPSCPMIRVITSSIWPPSPLDATQPSAHRSDRASCHSTNEDWSEQELYGRYD